MMVEQMSENENRKAESTKSLRTYTVPEAGEMARLSPQMSYRAARNGEIPTIKFGRLRRVPAELWDRILAGSK